MFRSPPVASLRALALTFALLSLAAPAQAASRAAGPRLGEPVTPHRIDVDLRQLPREPQWQPGMTIREAHRRQYFPLGAQKPHAPADKPTAVDALPELQRLWDEGARNARITAPDTSGRVTINNPNTGVSPGDPVVEVGTSHVIYAVNATGGTQFTVYNKAGGQVAGPTAFRTLAPAGNACATSVSDPIVLFDRMANRWFMLEMGGTSSGFRLCVYVSRTADPVSGGWWFYGFATPTLPDYPHCGVWDNAYVCTTNEGGAGVAVYAFDRANMLTGATARPAQRFTNVPRMGGYGFQALTPVSHIGSAAPAAGRRQLLARHRDDEAHDAAAADGAQDFLELYEAVIDWNTPTNSTIATLPRLGITEFNSWFLNYTTFATVPQPGSTARLDPIREVLLNQLTYRNFGTHESVVGTFATNQNPARTGTVVDSGIRWFELRRSGGGNWTLHQESTFSPGDSNTHHLLGTAAMDKFGNIGMGYNLTRTGSPTLPVSLLYTGRSASDPLGVMTLGENTVATGTAAETSGRWGDYYQLAVDPVDDCTFWLVGMYRPAGSWQTRIQDFKFPGCQSPPVITSFTCSGTGGGYCSVSYTPTSPTPTFTWSGGYSSSCTGPTCSGVCGNLGSFTIKVTVTVTNAAGSTSADAWPFCQRSW
jgi:hypothetical protein